MRALLFITACFVVGFLVGHVAGRRSVDRVDVDAGAEADRHWREGQRYGEAKGYADGWTTGRLQLVQEQDAKRHHPTGSPLSHLRALDAEADRRMKGDG